MTVEQFHRQNLNRSSAQHSLSVAKRGDDEKEIAPVTSVIYMSSVPEHFVTQLRAN
jgi:hypothetical protein